jgi:hypothetical protein
MAFPGIALITECLVPRNCAAEEIFFRDYLDYLGIDFLWFSAWRRSGLRSTKLSAVHVTPPSATVLLSADLIPFLSISLPTIYVFEQ